MAVTVPAGNRPLQWKDAASAPSLQLTDACYYQLRLANGRRDEVGVNPDPKESNLDVIPDDVLALWKGQGNQTQAAPANAGGSSAPAKAQKLPESFWWYVMLLVMIAALAESVVASRYLGTLREGS